MGIFQHDNVDRSEVERLVDAFPGQSIDFFGALRARVYDDKVRQDEGRAGQPQLSSTGSASMRGPPEPYGAAACAVCGAPDTMQ
jgi:hypothetical protein